MGKPTDLLQGTLDLLILKTLALDPMHGWGITLRIQQITGEVLQVQPGSLYPALTRLEHRGWITAKWAETDAARRARVLLAHASWPPTARTGDGTVAPVVRRCHHTAGDKLSAMSMRIHHRVFMALRSLLRRRTVERELDDELRFHLHEMETQEAKRAVAPGEARRRARLGFGGFDQAKEACRDMRTLRGLEQGLQDLRFGARLLVRSPIFAAVAMLSLALGIGATSTMLSLINAIVLRPLPISQPEQLHIAQVTRPDEVHLRFSYPAFESAHSALADRAEMCAQSSIESMLVGIRGGGAMANEPVAGYVQLVSGDCFDLFRQRAQVGRLLGPDDNRVLGQHPAAVISDGYWTRRFGRSAAALGSELLVNGAPIAIVGITAPGFFGATVDTRAPDIWLPITMQAAVRFAGTMRANNGDPRRPWPPQRELSWLNVFLRVQPSGTAVATEVMNAVMQREAALLLGDEADAVARQRLQESRVTLVSGARGLSPMRTELRSPLIALFGVATLVLVIACTNLASLLLARATGRRREMAIRLSIGAGRGRLVRQLFTESLMLALAGGALGVAIAQWGSKALVTFVGRGAAVTGIDVSPDWRVIALTLAIAIVTSALFGLLPALRTTRVPLAETLKSQTRSVIGSGGRRSRISVGKLLVAGQMGVSILLLVVAALFVRSLQAVAHVDVGFDADRLLVARLDPRASGFATAELPDLYRRLVESVASVPGVVGVSLSANGLFSGSRTTGDFEAEGYERGRDERLLTSKEWITADYFRTVGLTITQGRGFGPEDSASGRPVSVINERMAQRYFRGQNPVGKRWGSTSDFGADGVEIVGVVENARSNANDVRGEPSNMVYLPASQSERYLGSLEVRVAGRPETLALPLQLILRQTEPRLSMAAIETLNQRIARSMGGEQLLSVLTMVFSAVALSLACLGLYGTVSYAVTRRTAELGMRMALGATRGHVKWIVIRDALALVLVGLLVGLPAAFLLAQAMEDLLHGVASWDPAAYGAAIAVLLLCASLAAFLPARRASRLDPMLALRTDA